MEQQTVGGENAHFPTAPHLNNQPARATGCASAKDARLPGQGGVRNFFSTFFGFELDFCRIGGKLNSVVLQMGY